MKTNLSLNKETIARLNNNEMYAVRGGDTTPQVTNDSFCPTRCVWQTCDTYCIDTCKYSCVCTVGTGMCC